MSIQSFFQSIKNVFWFGSVSEDLKKKPLSKSKEERDIFFRSKDVVDYEESLQGLTDWFKEVLENPECKVNDRAETESYMRIHLKVTSDCGDFALVYYENDELILRGDRDIVPDILEPLSSQLDLDFNRI